MIDIRFETLLTPAQAAAFFPTSNGRKAHVSRVYRYFARGLRGVILESVQVGSLRCTSLEAIARFVQRLQHAGSLRNSALRQNRAEPSSTDLAEERLRALGL